MKHHDSDWYRSFFGRDYLDVYGHLLPDSQEKLAAAYGADLEQLMERETNKG